VVCAFLACESIKSIGYILKEYTSRCAMIKIERNSMQGIQQRFNIFETNDNRTFVNVIKAQIKEHPDCFFPFGAIEKPVLMNELKKYDFEFPLELINFWIEFGGGELWQTENILYPLESDDYLIERLIHYNQSEKETGFDQNYMIFASNTVQLVAFNKKNHSVKIFRPHDENYKIDKEFDNIIEWLIYVFWEQHNYVAISK